uniref:Uncharacterized protein n=1 Tax=Glossina palpalis gambiensis TaxID=67801 RepID=A0A1B0B2M0_9MUSC
MSLLFSKLFKSCNGLLFVATITLLLSKNICSARDGEDNNNDEDWMYKNLGKPERTTSTFQFINVLLTSLVEYVKYLDDNNADDIYCKADTLTTALEDANNHSNTCEKL